MSLKQIQAAIDAMERYESTETYTKEAIKLVLAALTPLHAKCIEHDRDIRELKLALSKTGTIVPKRKK